VTHARYARQIAVPGVGARGQRAFASADVIVGGDQLAAEVCALYLAGAGIGTLAVAPRLTDVCRALSSEVRVIANSEPACSTGVEVALALEPGGARARFVPDASDDPVRDGSIAARWVLARLLSANVANANVVGGGDG
jgi:hypothetical protein